MPRIADEQISPFGRAAYSVDEVAQRLGISRSGLYRAIGRGQLKASKFGARTLITAEAEREFLTSLRRDNQGETQRQSG